MTVRGARFAVALLVGVGVAVPVPVASAAPVPLIGTQWRFEASGFARTAPVKYSGAPAFFSIKGAGGGGNDGCNVFGMTTAVRGESVTFSGMVSTMRACIRPGASAQFRAAFAGERTVRITGDRLRVSDGARGYWDFVAAAQSKR
ncbi:META domain-containing protein [Tsukamurella sp. NPDC003166]|uniref:META domain-containing protein n=1 Tax=Tsukamurella sp. NPDC003166 TaxID=3154444 RepID=UPI0033A2FCD6